MTEEVESLSYGITYFVSCTNDTMKAAQRPVRGSAIDSSTEDSRAAASRGVHLSQKYRHSAIVN